MGVISGYCHDVTVHAKITSAAVSGSTEFANYLQDNNISSSMQYPDIISVSSDLNPVGPTPSGMIIDGSIWEDDDDVDSGGHRPYNHFYDPISKQGLSVLWPWPLGLITYGLPSETWGAFYDEVNKFNRPDFNEYSWQNARTYQSNAIVDVASYARDGQEAVMFSSIGQVMHLLEDTSQPQHVRNEQHLDQFPRTTVNTPWRSVFEDWGWHNLGNINFSPTNLDWMAAGFTQMSDFWDRNLYNGTSYAPLNANENGGPTLGLAEFCNGNFLTVRGSYFEFPGKNTNGSFGVTAYRYPSIYSTDFIHYLLNPAAYAKLIPNSIGLYGANTAVYRCVLTKSSQGVSVPEHCAIDLLAALNPGILGTNAGSLNAVHPDDPDVMANYHSILIPRAIAYSTGLLNYYFRGRLQILCSSSNEQTCSFTASNASPQAFHGGVFRAFSDDSDGNRTEATDLSTTYTNYPATNGYLPTNGTISGSFTIPANSSGTFTLAYFGTIDNGVVDPVDANIACASVVFSSCPCMAGPVVRILTAGLAFADIPTNHSYLALDNIKNWVLNYDMSTIPWNRNWFASFSADSTNAIISQGLGSTGVGFPNATYLTDPAIPSGSALYGFQRVQCYFPSGTNHPYLMLCVGWSAATGNYGYYDEGCSCSNIISVTCTGDRIVEVPWSVIPGYPYVWIFLKDPTSYGYEVFPDLLTLVSSIYGYPISAGPDFSLTQICGPGHTNDPFGGQFSAP
jgi:hypothetical protein